MAALPENDRIAGPFIAVAGQTDFPADFPLIRAEGLRARIERGGVVMELAGDDLAAVDDGPVGFTCRLAVPALAGDRCWIYSRLPAARLRQHTPNGAVRTPTLEGDAVEMQAQLQEHRERLSRGMTAPLGETGFELPPAAARALKLAGYDATGKPTAVDRAVAAPASAFMAEVMAFSPDAPAAWDRLSVAGVDANNRIRAEFLPTEIIFAERFGVTPEANDVGARLNGIIADAAPGSLIMIPPSLDRYVLEETVELDKDRLCVSTGAGFSLGMAAPAFRILATDCRLQGGMDIQGQRTAGQAGVEVFGSRGVVNGLRASLVDYIIDQGVGAGFHNAYADIHGRNARLAPIRFRDGVGPALVGLSRYDTDGAWYGGPYAEPQLGGILVETEGFFLEGYDFIHSGGLQIRKPSYRNIEWGLVGLGYIDSTTSRWCEEIVNDHATGYIRGIFHAPSAWLATGRGGAWTYGVGEIDGCFWDGGPNHNHVREGYRFDQGTNLIVNFPKVYGCNAPVPMGSTDTDPGDISTIVLNTPGRIRILFGAARGPGLRWSTTPKHNVEITAACAGGDIEILGLDVSGPTTTGEAIKIAPEAASSVRIVNVPGFDSPSRVPGGTASAPAYSFHGDTQTGVFRPEATAVALTTLGSERLRVGGTAPAAGLWVEGLQFGRTDLIGLEPSLNLKDTDAATNRKFARLWNADGQIALQAMTDAYGVQNAALTAVRGAAGFDRLDLGVPLKPLIYTRQTLPTPTAANVGWVNVSNYEAGKSRMVYNDGSTWWYQDGSTVSLT
jgi:hypothetical protein